MNPLQKLAASALIACSTLIVTPAAAHDHSSDSITINHPWSRPTPPGVPMGVGYMVITNHSDSDITLTSATTPRAKSVSIHESTMTDGTMSMRPLKGGLTIPAGETVELKPHSYHMMLEKLDGPLKEGERVPLTVSFDGAETMEVKLKVAPLDGEMKMEGDGMDHFGH
ncbi:Copper metallochaperone, bacterial analog of Cox17 protein [Marinobacter salarius]|uniref:copper chaperone PCu(A)C n=1 Tax=Marinobacter salarius TaxID=1420917 RepID=UPI001252EEF6|nr:copper chaperone PCu(A)C [Marinobacter salarius]VVT30643.1 Metal-binding protein [Marinobacter salarius]VXB06439.1 Copper metallochaperone, bacterial analog of Cox17 protein [Marinobacter salarius]